MPDAVPTTPSTTEPGTGATAATGITCPRCGTVANADARFCPACGAPITASAVGDEDHLINRLRAATQGEYDVLRRVGHGGMAAVYLAWDRELARYVAIKVLLPELAHHPTMSQRFLQEARTAANLDDHPNVVRVYRAKEAGGLRYFVMKYVDGCSIDQLLRATGPLATDLAAHVVDQVALALQYAHARGVVHRDVKPGNILLDRSGSVVVTDFGIAKVAEAEQLTRTGFAIGTPHYMSPEQWRVEPLTPASDQYALGVVAFHLVTGMVPFDGTQYLVQEQHLHAEPPTLEVAGHAVPPAFSAVVRRMLAKAPADRFPDLRSVSQALAAIPRDAAPALRERLSELIPAAHAPGIREVPPPELRAANGPDVAVDRRAGPRVGDATPTGRSNASPAAAPRVVTGNDADPPVAAMPAAPAPETEDVPALARTTVRPLPPSIAQALGALTPPVGTPGPVSEPLAAPASAPIPTRVAAPVAAPMPLSDVESDPAQLVAATDLPRASGVLEGPITRRDGPSRLGPWLAAAVVGAVLIGGGVAWHTHDSGGTSGPPARSTTAKATSGAPAPAPQDSTGGVVPGANQLPPVADSTADPVPADTPSSVPPGPPAAVVVVGAPARGTLTVPAGDSVRLRARVNDARGTRLVDAVVQWASSDPARVAFRNGYAVAVAPGGPVDVTATSGALSRAVHIAVGPRAGAGAAAASVRAVARPTAAELRAEVQHFVDALASRDVDAVARRLAPRAVDGSASRDFVQWLSATRGVSADPPALGDPSDEGARARVAFRVPLRWQSGGGSLGDHGRKDLTFWMTLTHDDQGWHGGEVLLGGKVEP